MPKQINIDSRSSRELLVCHAQHHPVCQAGYTTSSGVIKPDLDLESFHLFSHHPKSDLQKIFDTDTVKVVLVALASDGTASKPGLEFDRRHRKLVIGLVHNVDAEFVRKHPIPDPEAIKKNLVVNATSVIQLLLIMVHQCL